MKKVSKLKLTQNAELMDESAMKKIVGGYGSGCYMHCNDGFVIGVNKCMSSNTYVCNGHGGPQNCNGPSSCH